MGRIIDHTHPAYENLRHLNKESRWNGAYFYSCEIVNNIIPKIETDRNWITINRYGAGLSHSIVFIHNNLHPEKYDWLKEYRDLVLVCGIPETVEKVEHLGEAFYLPLSVDVAEVRKHLQRKTKNVAFCGRKSKGYNVPEYIEHIQGMPRGAFLNEMARFEKVYAVGRVAIEAKILGCEVLPYDPRFPDPERWEIFDNAEAAEILQAKLDLIDGKREVEKPNT